MPEDDIKLPEPAVKCGDYAGPPGEGASEALWSEDQVRAAVLQEREEWVSFAAKMVKESAAAERERCAKVCDAEAQRLGNTKEALVAGICAAAIRGQ